MRHTSCALVIAFLAGFRPSRAAGAPTPTPSTMSLPCTFDSMVVKSGVEFGQAVIGRPVTFVLAGYSRRPAGEFIVDWGDGSPGESFRGTFDTPFTFAHTYSRKGSFTATAVGSKDPRCLGRESVNVTVGDPPVLGKVTTLLIDAGKVLAGVPMKVTVQGQNGSVPCTVNISWGDRIFAPVTQGKGLLPLRFEKTYPQAGEFVLTAAGSEGCTGVVKATVPVQRNLGAPAPGGSRADAKPALGVPHGPAFGSAPKPNAGSALFTPTPIPKAKFERPPG